MTICSLARTGKIGLHPKLLKGLIHTKKALPLQAKKGPRQDIVNVLVTMVTTPDTIA